MKFSYENEDLIEEVIQDLAEFGSDLKVIAIYSVFPEAYESAMDDYLESLEMLEERKCKRMTVYELAQILKEQAEIF